MTGRSPPAGRGAAFQAGGAAGMEVLGEERAWGMEGQPLRWAEGAGGAGSGGGVTGEEGMVLGGLEAQLTSLFSSEHSRGALEGCRWKRRFSV